MFGERIKNLRIEKEWTQDYVCSKLNISAGALSRYETGMYEPKSLELVKDFANLFGVSTDYLLGKTSERNKNSSSVAISVYGKIPAGIPMELIEDIIDTEEIDSDMLRGDKEFFGLKIQGDSMFPEYLNGDIIILEKCQDCESGQDCVVMVNGNDGTFKRVFKNESGIILQPLNSQYSPMIYTNEQIEKLPVKIIGRVVELRRKK